MAMPILVAGGNGFIGTYAMRYLAEAGADVVCLDINSPKKLLGDYTDRIKFYQGSAEDTNRLVEIIKNEKIERIIYLVSILNPECTANPLRAYRLNIMAAVNALDLARIMGVQRFVYASSASVYGNVSAPLLDEEAPKNPFTTYGMTKLAVEHFGLHYHEMYGLDFVAVRPPHAYGAGRSGGYHKLNDMIAAAHKGEPLAVWGGSQTYDPLYIKDSARAFALLALAAKTNHRTYNIGTGQRIRLADVGAVIKRVLPQARLTIEPGFDKQGSDRNRTDQPPVNLARIEAEVGWRPEYTLEQGIKDFVLTMETTRF